LAGVLLALGMVGETRALLSPPAAPSPGQGGGAERQFVVGLLAAHEGKTGDAIAALELAAASERECPICVLPDLARAHARANDPLAAALAAERYLGTPYIHRFEPDAAHLGATLQLLAEQQERQGATSRAISTYRRLLQLWQSADEEMTPRLARIRARLEALESAR
jgi:hypothetical protein